ncbi:MAG: hypothetical protein HYW85_01425, partial [Deltaproteobacteria bacterium]|nr:hypothetical protein [Deltaproteobacteria bacterium]
AYVKNFVTVQYSKFKDDLYYALPKNPTFVERVTTELFPQEKRQRVEAILRDIKGLSQKFLTEVPQKSPLKKEGLKKIQDIQVDWPSQSSGIMTKLGLLGSVTQENASYLGEGGYNEMQVNGLSLHAPYWRMFGQLAHEVGHSIQPHEEAWRSFWKKFVDCIQQPGLDFQVHHIEEIFADWFSTELLMRQIQGLSQEEMRGAVLESVGFCEPSSQYVARVREGLTAKMVPNPHPDSDSRVNKILRAHPFFNKLFGCPSSPAYCAP